MDRRSKREREREGEKEREMERERQRVSRGQTSSASWSWIDTPEMLVTSFSQPSRAGGAHDGQGTSWPTT